MEAIHLPSLLIGIATVLCVVLATGYFGWPRSGARHAAPERPPAEEMRQIHTIEEQLGLSQQELRQELSRGKSIMDIAREHGRELRLPPRWMNDKDHQLFLERSAMQIGISVEELKTELSSGRRLLDIAEEYGVILSFPDRSPGDTFFRPPR